MILFVENNDSFSWNVLDLLPFPPEAVRVVRSGAGQDLRALLTSDVERVVVGPGPMDPHRVGLVPFVQEVARRRLPYLGICLGHQALGLAFGAELVRSTPAHGQRAVARFAESRTFASVRGDVEVMRYHSLSLRDVRAPLKVVASLGDGTVMAVEHESLPMAGLQFHPDSFGTPRGFELLGGAKPPATSKLVAPEPWAGRNPTPLRLSTLEGDFALLAPSFAPSPRERGEGRGEGPWTFIDLASATPNATLWHARAEGRPIALRGEARPVTLNVDVPPDNLTAHLDESGFLEGVGTIRNAIAAGDVYQVNLTLRAALSNVSGGAGLLSALCRRGVPRFGAWVRAKAIGEFVSASPELLVETSGRNVRVEPMKGTAAPSQRAWLEASEKDRAELAMITDLLRDDLHRLCVRGGVAVPNSRRFIELPYVLQTVADVVGTLREGVSVAEVLAQVHPGGSVTGAPRVAACEQIARLEPTPRGAYCGMLGLELGDAMTAALLIRTAERTAGGWTYGVGSGITWDSVPEQELDEVRLKLGALQATDR
ncbi:MAG: chorismate-binding protein [Myxococcaceae bacterium]